MPGPGQQFMDIVRNIMSESAFDGILKGVFKEVTTPKRPDSLVDESVGSFISRRISPQIADNLASALFHGIYAGDIYQLSAKSILPIPWMREGKHGNMASAGWQAMTEKTSWNFCDELELQTKLQDTQWEPKLKEQIPDASVFTFKNGLGMISEQLARRLSYNGNVTIRKSTKITNLEKEEDSSKIKVSFVRLTNKHLANNMQLAYTPTGAPSDAPEDSQNQKTFSHVVSTISPSITFDLFSDAQKQSTRTTSLHRPLSSTLTSTPSVTVCVVNLYYRTPHLLQTLTPPGGLPRGVSSLQGFGYLLPRSLPFAQNPERALGVIFDSDITPHLHTTIAPDKLGTRLTVMLGGHWWDGWTSFPSNAEAEEMAQTVLARHLGIVEEPAAMRATLQTNCIPQYTVGHSARMGEAHAGLLDAFGGKLRVAGSWYHGVGVNDCLRSAFEVVQGLSKEVNEGELGRNDSGDREARTGLERFAWGRPLALVKRQGGGELDVVEVEEAAVRQGYFGGMVRTEKRG